MMEFILGNWVGSLLRIIGACVLYAMGQLAKLFRPSAEAYSFKTIYNMDYDRGDSYKQMMERAGQQMAGALFIGFVVLICILVKYL
ncbi:hypothetical protein [Mucilaginibacter sp.]|uniref:hypothetical protein n=1 Tax=Mucilaginibacter sp. TaxID=1882438 RepID=UPI002633364E|nr:hypothetical protein [Mucilaginibacter sp.]MDB5126389.1 hypothetical protein [Mucilaginibacter sp.]